MSLKPLGEIALSTLLNLLNSEFKNKVDKEEGKGLSTNDYTDEDKSKISSITTCTIYKYTE